MADRSPAKEVQAVPVSSPQTPVSSPAHQTSTEQDKQPHHGHSHHDPKIIQPPSTTTTHLDPGAVVVKP